MSSSHQESSTPGQFTNTFSPALALPEEIIGPIFEQVIAESAARFLNDSEGLSALRHADQVRYISQICSRWRRVSLSWHSLWTCLPLKALSSNNRGKWVERSGRMPLAMAVADHQGMELVSKVVPRIRHLELAGPQLSETDLHGRCFEQLETLVFRDWLQFRPLLWSMPVLRRLEIVEMSRYRYFEVRRSALKGVQVFSLAIIPRRAPWDHLFVGFEGSEGIAKLRLLNVYSPPTGIDNLLSTMRHVKHLHLSHLKTTLFADIFSRASCPELQSLTIADDTLSLYPETRVPLIIDFLQRSPTLSSMTLRIYINTPHVLRFFSRFAAALRAGKRQILPNLQDLYLVFYPSDIMEIPNKIREALCDFLASLSELPAQEAGAIPDTSLSLSHSLSVSDRTPLTISKKGWSEVKVGSVRLMMVVGLESKGPIVSIPNFRPQFYENDW